MPYTSIEPVGDRCVLVRVGEHVDVETSRAVHAITAHLSAKKLRGVIEVVPAFTTVAVHFQPMAFLPERGLPTAQLTRSLEDVLAEPLPELPPSGRVVDIPACYGGEFGPDLEDVAQRCGISAEEVIALHSGSTLTLYAFFFSPGNPFAGPVDPRLNVGRRSSPRTRVEAGSVAIANGISSIYQTASPGGWNVIARTPWNLFDVDKQPPTRLQLGDLLRFKPITPEQFKDLLEPRA
ncbi:5-oxoprolinase subunit PxpB [Variovorax defluvii]|uniref:5-oxoprolinase subunit PxpB n=1 Tax=Variovorax defluvii TaxID=913761 RepID=A0ABP8H4V6_9BURK